MSRIRTVKPELFRHEELYEAERASQLPIRLAFIGLLTCCDREGRFRWRPKQLKLDILPYDDVDFDNLLNSLVKFGFILRYEVNHKAYGCIPSWHKHQCINNKEMESLLPSIEESKLTKDNHVPSTASSFSHDVSAKTNKTLSEIDVANSCLTREARVVEGVNVPDSVHLKSLSNSEGEGNGKGIWKRKRNRTLSRPRDRRRRITPSNVFFIIGKS